MAASPLWIGLALSVGLVGLPVPAAAADLSSVAADVADVATRACFGAASGAIALQHADFATEERQLAQVGLAAGIPSGVFETIGPAGQSMLNRATMAHRDSGDYHILLAAGGNMANCRVLIVGGAAPELPDAVTDALSAADAGWTPLPQTQRDTEGGATRQRFIRRDQANRPYLLDALAIRDPQRRLRMALIVSAWPADVPMPGEGAAGSPTDSSAVESGAAFAGAADAYAQCLRAATELGMRLKIVPATFRDGLAQKCRNEEAAFRTRAIEQAIALGRTEEAAASEIDGNIARARAAFVADQESYVRTGRVPR